MKIMIDTGATNTLITQQALSSTRHKKYFSTYLWKLYHADGQTPLEVLGVVQHQIKINSTTTDISAYVVKRLCSPCLLGQDYINKYQMKIDAGSQTITIIQNKTETTTNIIKRQRSFRLINSISETSIDNLLLHLKDDVQRSTLKQTFLPYAKIFDISKPPIANTMIKHAINIIEHPPRCSKSYQFSYEEREALYNIVKSLMESGHVRESNSSYASPAILVEKKDKSWRLVIDYKKLNAITIKDEFLLSNMEDTLQEVGNGFAFFSKLDLKSGFWQLPIDPKDRHKMAFKTPFGLFAHEIIAGVVECAETIYSAEEKSDVVQLIAKRSGLSEKQFRVSVEAINDISADNQKTISLKAFLLHEQFTGQHLDVVLSAIGTIYSSADKQIVFTDLIRNRYLKAQHFPSILDEIEEMSDDSRKSNVLCKLAPRLPKNDANVREAYLMAADSIYSSKEKAAATMAFM
ncbi:unnamed protein product [Didymodactylos carnosus]|uniref:Reverse transcriptase domain-containing protein n=1 Tax=Didymodactylos carnosus TaxID=1234261 RepID=A0A815YIM5_9BILA|nr:unnamed protein product [Didymodactylos carnosus]CAF4434921.1 unnamed protein product [Didymodactylos carnosus]